MNHILTIDGNTVKKEFMYLVFYYISVSDIILPNAIKLQTIAMCEEKEIICGLTTTSCGLELPQQSDTQNTMSILPCETANDMTESTTL